MSYIDELDKEMRLRFGAVRVKLRHGPLVDNVYYNGAEEIRLLDMEKFAAKHDLRVTMNHGTADVVIQVPRKSRKMIWLEDLLASNRYKKSVANLPIILGVNTVGRPVVFDLTRLPHLLIGGGIGTGKSQLLHSIIASLIRRFSPSQCKLILMDFNGKEFAPWAKLSHLEQPVIKECVVGIDTLKWVMNEIDSRYDCLAQHGTICIQEYNKKADKPMPYLVIVIDEFSYLMKCAPREFEDCVISIVKKARMVGIHIVMATRQLRRDKITQKIQSYFVSRISFHARNASESKVILGGAWAQNLVDYADALFCDAGHVPMRIHTPYIDIETSGLTV